MFRPCLPGLQALPKNSRPKVTPKLVGTPLPFHFLESKFLSRRFSAYRGDQYIPTVPKGRKHRVTTGKPRKILWTPAELRRQRPLQRPLRTPVKIRKSRAAKRGGVSNGEGFPIRTCPSFFVLFGTFPVFSKGSVTQSGPFPKKVGNPPVWKPPGLASLNKSV